MTRSAPFAASTSRLKDGSPAVLGSFHWRETLFGTPAWCRFLAISFRKARIPWVMMLGPLSGAGLTLAGLVGAGFAGLLAWGCGAFVSSFGNERAISYDLPASSIVFRRLPTFFPWK